MRFTLFAIAVCTAALVALITPQATAAQEESPVHSMTFDGHMLEFPTSLANSAAVIVYDTITPNENNLEQAPRLQFRIGGVEFSSIPLGAVEIYRLDEIAGTQAETSFAELRALLDERPELDEYLADYRLLPTAFPFIEARPQTYTFSTRATYYESEQYTGIASINARIYAMSYGVVFMRYNLEAISSDGVWGVSARFDLRAEYPETLETLGDPDQYAEAVVAYLLETPADEFQPPLTVLDQVFATIRYSEE